LEQNKWYWSPMVATLCPCAAEKSANRNKGIVDEEDGHDKKLAGPRGEKYASGLRGKKQ